MISRLIVIIFLSVACVAQAPAPQPYFTEPSLSPDRAEIAFASGGDLWTVPANGGEARLLVSHPATESRPLYSPDGKRLAFVSTRTGNGDIYVLTLASGELARLTFDDAPEQLDAWSRDGRWIYFSSTSKDIAGMGDVHRVSADGGTPMPVTADRYASEYFAVPSPDGTALAFTARGIVAGQWWRKGHSHLDESEIWLLRAGRYEKLAGREGVPGGEKTVWPMWSADDRNLYYMSDRGGAENLWTRAPGGRPRQLTQFRDGRLLWPSISYDGKEIVFERNFEIWKMDSSGGTPRPVKIARRGRPAGPAVEHMTLNTGLQEMALSPDGKKVVFVVRGEIFAASAKDGGDAARVTRSPGNEYRVSWAPDSKRLVYLSDRDGTPHIYLYDFPSGAETRLTNSDKIDVSPRFSPDGKHIAFERDARELRVLDMESKQERVLYTGLLERPPFGAARCLEWSPDSKWIAFYAHGAKSLRNVYVVPAAGGEAQPVSFLGNLNGGGITWSPDGKYLLFHTGQRTEPDRIARIDLVPRAPRFREDQFRDLFKDEPARPAGGADARKAEPPKVEIVFEGIRRRLSFLPLGVDAGVQVISPDGKWVLMPGDAAGQVNLYLYSLDELAREAPVTRQLTSTAGNKSAAQFTPDSKEVYYLEQGRIQMISVESRQPRPLAVSAAMDVDFQREKMEVFQQAWSYLRDAFFDPNFHGVSWTAARGQYAPYVSGASTSDEVRRIINLMLGELNASHMGISGPGAGPGGPPAGGVGKLGLRFDRTEWEERGRLRVSEVIPLGPVALAGNVKSGDDIVAVDGTAVESRTNIDQLLENKVARRVTLSVLSGGTKRDVVVRPITTAAEKQLLYRQWVDQRREYVNKISGGKLGYAHMPDMSGNSLEQLHVDLDPENHSREGVVIDLRNNNGGFVNVYAIDVLARRHYLTMTFRGMPPAPARTVLGQRALELPTILVTNQHSLSDAEDFTEGYRVLGLGKVVGEPTAGWIIYTGGATLIDGSNLRLPGIRITTRDGQDMEMHPRPVDIPVVRPIGESERDSQLDAAVKELLAQIARK